jgi:rhamnosyltransferase
MNSGNGISISIIVLSKNGARFIAQLLNKVYSQKVDRGYEVIIIDSGSTDGTLDILKNYPLRLIEIPPQEFGHGKTRNLGAQLAQSEILVFLNGDAIPKDSFWLLSLIRTLEKSDDIAGAYSKVLPREDCNPLRAREILNDASYQFRETKIKSITDINLYNNMSYGEKRIFLAFETISCAIKKPFLQKFSFRDDIEFGEDLEWSKRIMEAGFKIAFEPSSQVVHSHDFYCSLAQTVKKFFDDAKLNKDLLGYCIEITPFGFLYFITTKVILDIKYISKLNKDIFYKAKWALYCPLVRIFQFVGILLGCYSQKIPLKFHRKISLVSDVKNSSKNLWG